MKDAVLVIGSGGREHAIARALRESPRVGDLFCAPGNAGTALLGTNVDLKTSDHAAVLRFIEEKNIRLTVVGPEAPLVDGLADGLREKGHMVLGASKKAAQLEGSKVYAKTFMAKYGLPTAGYRIFDDPVEAVRFARSAEGHRYRVMKADGLAAGKGVIIAHSTEELVDAINGMMRDKKFGDAGTRVVLEETLKGPEVSVIALTDGKTVLPFPASQDHKRAHDGDRGPNTGGMGAYAPTPFYDDLTRVQVDKNVIPNFLRGLAAEKLDFRGIIYFGLMLTKDGPKVLEFNVRLGDPEAEVVLPLVASDLYQAFRAVAEGDLSRVRLERRPGAACTVIMASGGYPNKFETGFPIQGLDEAEREGRVIVFHAGTKKSGADVVTSGGRVLAVTGIGKSLESAVVRAYQGVKKISFKNGHFRNDIAAKALKNKHLTRRIKNMRVRYDREAELSRA